MTYFSGVLVNIGQHFEVSTMLHGYIYDNASERKLHLSTGSLNWRLEGSGADQIFEMHRFLSVNEHFVESVRPIFVDPQHD